MMVVMTPDATASQIEAVVERLEAADRGPGNIPAAQR